MDAADAPTPGENEWEDDLDIIMSIIFKWVGVVFQTSPTVAAGMTAFMFSSVLYLVSGIVSRIFFKTYRELPLKDQQRWNSGVNRAVGALMLATRGLSTMLQGLPEDGFVWGTSPYLERTSAYALGFFIFEVRDSLNIYLAHGIFEETLLVHHTCGVLIYVVALASQSYQFAVALVLVEEICAPMVHCGWVLTKLDLGNHWLWDANQYTLILCWFVFRIGTDLLLWYYFITNAFEILYGPTFPMLLNLMLLGMLSCILNPYWLRMKIRQFRNRDIKYKKAASKIQ